MEESELIKFVQKFLEKGIEADEIKKHKNLKLDESSQDNQHRKIVGIGSLQGLELVEISQGRSRRISGLKLPEQELYINLDTYTHPFKEDSKNSIIKITINECELEWLHISGGEDSHYKNFSISIGKEKKPYEPPKINTKIQNLILFGIKAQKVALTNCHLNRLHTFNSGCLQEIELNDCSGNLDFGDAEQGSEKTKISIFGGDYDNISIKNHKTSSIELKGVKCQFPIIVDGRAKDKEKILQFKSLEISGNTSEVRVDKYDIDHLSIKDVVHQGNSTFKDVGVKKLTIDSTINLGKVTFLNLKPINPSPSDSQKLDDTQSLLEIINSTLGNTYFINSQLSDFHKTNIQGVDLTEIKSINTKWPDNINEDDLAQSKEIYRQLKLIMTNSRDKMNELKFFQKEHETHLKELCQKNLSYKKREFWDRLSLWTSKHTNDFGNDYTKPIVIYFVASLGLYLQVLLFTYYREIGFAIAYPFIQGKFLDFDWQKLNHYLVKYVEFLNPTHGIYFIKEISFFSAVIDFLSKIIFGFLIYQTIVAFRKLYRK